MAPSDKLPKTKRKRKPRAKEPKIDLAGYLERICGVDLTQVIWLNVLSGLLIVSEIGVDMSKWRKAFRRLLNCRLSRDGGLNDAIVRKLKALQPSI